MEGKHISIKSFVAHNLKRIRGHIFYLIDFHYDMRICGQSLSRYIPSVYRDDKNGIGMTGTESTRYPILKKIFSNIQITEKDSFMDVGCGMGRVLAFCIKEKYPCSLNGIEINEISGNIALSWVNRYDQIRVEIGDAFKIDYNPYTILFLFRSFLPKTFLEFIKLLESNLTHPITLLYYADQQSGWLLNERPGWKIKKREIVKKIYGIRLPENPQWYSIWEYIPQKNPKHKNLP